MMETPIKRPFSALNGIEVKKLILAGIAKELDADPRLEQHLTYPVVAWESVTTLEYYPGPEEPLVFTAKGEAKAEGAKKTGRPAQTAALTNKVSVDAENPPDKVREEAGLPVPEPRITSQGVVDIGADFA